jgi:hypothetical protein
MSIAWSALGRRSALERRFTVEQQNVYRRFVDVVTSPDVEPLALFSVGGLLGTSWLMHFLPVTAQMAVVLASAV